MDAIKTLLEWRGCMKLKDAAEFLSMKPSNLRKIITRGELVGYRVGGEWRLNPHDLLAYLHERRNT
jgi:excisionase family DNA binding protein